MTKIKQNLPQHSDGRTDWPALATAVTLAAFALGMIVVLVAAAAGV